jgi:hypothetical protein
MIKMKRKIVFVIAFFSLSVLMAGVVTAAQVQVSVSDTTGNSGEVVDIPVTVSDANNIGSIDLVITYDPTILQVDSVSKGDLNNGMISSNTETDGILSLAIADQSGIDGDGEIAIISFSVIGQTGSSPLQVESLSVYDVESVEIDATAENGLFTVDETSESESNDTTDETPGFETFLLLVGISMVIVALRGRKR